MLQHRPALDGAGKLTIAQRKLVSYQLPRDVVMLLAVAGIVFGFLERTSLCKQVTETDPPGTRKGFEDMPVLFWFDAEHGFPDGFPWHKKYYQSAVWRTVATSLGYNEITSHCEWLAG